jgi:hypothetical protein
MLTSWYSLAINFWLKIRRLLLETVSCMAALCAPQRLPRKNPAMTCHTCAIPMVHICPTSGYPNYGRCPQCGLITFLAPADRHPHPPASPKGIISLDQKRKAKRY